MRYCEKAETLKMLLVLLLVAANKHLGCEEKKAKAHEVIKGQIWQTLLIIILEYGILLLYMKKSTKTSPNTSVTQTVTESPV